MEPPRLVLAPPMITDDSEYLDSLTERVLGAVFEVSNTLGSDS
jgi:hypothetical protein